MKKIFIAVTALLIATASLQAQTQKEAGTEKHHRGARGQKNGMKDLNLNEDQKKQFKEIGETYHKQFRDLKNDKSLSADDMKAKAGALKKERHEKMQSLLSPEQKTKMGEWKKAGEGRKDGAVRKDGARNWNKGGAGNRHGRGQSVDQMKIKLGLSDDQAAKLKVNQSGFRDKVKALHENTSLTDVQKKEQMKELAQKQKENLKSILTPEQLEKMKTGRKGRGADIKR